MDYIRNQLIAGYSPEEIRNILVQRGWYEAEINEAFNSVRQVQMGAEAAPKPPREKPPEETPPGERPPWEPPPEETPKEPPKEEPHKGRSKKKIAVLVIAALLIVYVLLVYGNLILAFIFYEIGIFDPSLLPLGGIATGFNVFGKPAVGDWGYSGTDFSIKLPGPPYDIEITRATAQVRGTTSCNPITNMEVQTGENIELSFNGCGSSTSGSSYYADVSITYTRPGMPLETVEAGAVTGVVA
ncbi:MAG: hypothetical protein JSV39_03105 [Candidatus Aenigmatarchaeota archaeon]|nr:MAG: hypothetical protein JSV39_03105 [Candidatus Aenigmarchaeota archaeon]